MAHWQTRGATLLMCHLLVFSGSSVVALEQFGATTSGFEDFGNFGGFRGFHQFHGWLSSALDDNAGSQSQGFPAGYIHPGSDDDAFSQILPGRQEEPDLIEYQTTPKTNNAKNSPKLASVHAKAKKLLKKQMNKSDHEVRVPYNVYEPTVRQEQQMESIHLLGKQRANTTDEDVHHDVTYESMKIHHQQQHKPSDYSSTEEPVSGTAGKSHVKGGIYGAYEPIIHHQLQPRKYIHSPKQRINPNEKNFYGRIVSEIGMQRLMKTIQKQKKPFKIPPTVKPQASKMRKINQGNSIYPVAYNGGFKPILLPHQQQLNQVKHTTPKQEANTKENSNNNNNVIYVFPNPYQQTLAAIDPAFRGVLKLYNPTEKHNKYLSYKSTVSTHVV